MATITLRPYSDISVNHTKSRTSSTGFSLINEATADDNTYLECGLTASQTNSATSTFGVTDTTISNKIYLQSVSLVVRAERYKNALANVNSESSSVTGGISINGGTIASGNSQSLSNSWSNKTFNVSPSGLNQKYNSFTDANIQIQLTTSGTYTTDKSPTLADRISQAYVNATYLNVWECKAYNIVGTGIASVTVSRNEVIETLENCTWTAVLEDGYKFLGWYSDEACTQLVTENLSYTTNPTSNISLYAKGAYVYHISIYGDDGCTVSSNKTECIYGDDITITASYTSRYVFEGWYKNQSRTTLETLDNPYTFSLESDVILYAKTRLNELMYVKIDGGWRECSEVYKKIDGQWILQTTLDGLFDENKHYKITKV